MVIPEIRNPYSGRCVACEFLTLACMKADPELTFDETYQRISDKAHGAGVVENDDDANS